MAFSTEFHAQPSDTIGRFVVGLRRKTADLVNELRSSRLFVSKMNVCHWNTSAIEKYQNQIKGTKLCHRPPASPNMHTCTD